MAARLAELGLGLFLVVSLVVGARLLVLARRTRRLPELLIGAGFVVGGALGYAPENLILHTDWVTPVWRPAVTIGSGAAIRLSALLMAVFTWRVFRPGEPWAAAFSAALALLLLAGWIAYPGPWGLAADAWQWRWSLFTSVVRSAAFGWSAVESLRAARAARRRAALGLADAVGAERLRLWGVAMTAVALMSSVPLGTRTVTVLAGHPLVSACESLLGVVAAAAMARTFFGRGRADTARRPTRKRLIRSR
jgi:hypothetical protein